MVAELTRTAAQVEEPAAPPSNILETRPYRVAEETYVISRAAGFGGVYHALNSVVIRGQEPIIVDTGTKGFRQQWLRDAFSLVDPKDVRWIFISHDDPDHIGNLNEVLAAAPNAKLLTTFFSIARMFDDVAVPMDRVSLLNDGDSIQAGDRRLTAIRPRYFDGPTTRGLFDHKTGFYWAVDSFAASLPYPADDAADVPYETYREGLLHSNRLNHPWHQWLDEVKFGRHVDRVQSLPIRAIATAHGPAVYGPMIEKGFQLLREIARMEPVSELTQVEFQAMLAAMAAQAA